MTEEAGLEPLDMAGLLDEINEEVARRRASGELTGEFERELDRTFAELAPVDALGADFDSIVTKIERSAVIDIRPSTVSAYPGASQMKQVVTKATAFYLRHVATQASGLFQAMARALRLLGERVDQLESQPGAGARVGAGELLGGPAGAALGAISSPAPVWWADFVIAQLGTPSGRVLHAQAGDGGLVRRLVDAGYDAYGTEPSEEAALAASDLVPDIRAVEAGDHLRTLPPDSLSGLILSGFIERLDVDSLMGLAARAASRLAPGGRLVVVSAHPQAWSRTGPPLAQDLAPGRPLHPETWQALLGRAGFTDLAVQLGARPQLALVADDAANENFRRLAEALGPADYAVSARRRR